MRRAALDTSSVPGWLVALVFLGGAALYLTTLNLQGFWFDEIQTVRGIRRPFADMVEARLSNGHPPLFFAISWVVLRLAGEHEVTLRLLPALAGLLSAALLYLLGRRLVGAWPGLVAAALLMFSPLQIGIAQQARGYTMVQALLLGATLILVRSEADSWREGLWFGLLTTLAAWTHFSALYVVGAQVLGLVVARRWRIAVSGLAAFGLAIPFVLAVLRLTKVRHRISWIGQGDPDLWVRVFARPYSDLVSTWLADPLVLTLSIALLVLGLVGLRRLSSHRILLLAIWIGPPLLALIANLLGAYATWGVSRYFAGSWVVAPLLVVAGIWSVGRVWRAGAAALLLALMSVSLAETFVDLRYGTRWSARDVAAIIGTEGQASDAVLLHTLERTDSHTLAYYAKRRIGDLSQRRGWGAGPRPGSEHGRNRAEPEGVWIVLLSPEPPEGRALERLQKLSERFPERNEWSIARAKLVRLAKAKTDPAGASVEEDEI